MPSSFGPQDNVYMYGIKLLCLEVRLDSHIYRGDDGQIASKSLIILIPSDTRSVNYYMFELIQTTIEKTAGPFIYIVIVVINDLGSSRFRILVVLFLCSILSRLVLAGFRYIDKVPSLWTTVSNGFNEETAGLLVSWTVQPPNFIIATAVVIHTPHFM